MSRTEQEIELEIERRCICEVEKVVQAEIDKIIARYPEIYGTSDAQETAVCNGIN